MLKNLSKRNPLITLLSVMAVFVFILMGVETVRAASLDRENLPDGTYELEIALWHATNDAPSMAGGVLTGDAQIIVENGIYTMFIPTQVANIMGQEATLEALRVFDLDGNPVEVSASATFSTASGTTFAFQMPHVEEFIAVEVVAMNGMMTQNARLRLDWDTLVQTSSEVPTIPVVPVPPASPTPPVTPVTPTPDVSAGSNNNSDILDIENLADGIYELEIALWHATNDAPSMANNAFVGTARIHVENGVYTMFTYTQPMSFGTITASLQSMRVETASGNMTQATIQTRTSGNPTSFSFTMPHTNQFIAVQVNPMVALMGNDYIDARLNVNWDTLTQIASDTDLTIAPSGATVGQTSTTPAVATSDSANTALYQAAFMTSGLAIGLYFAKTKSKKVSA